MKTYLPYIASWAVLAALVVFLAIYRRRLDLRVDESLHVLEAEAGAVPVQAEVAKKLMVVDRWGKILTVIAVLYLLGITGSYIYASFSDTSVKLN